MKIFFSFLLAAVLSVGMTTAVLASENDSDPVLRLGEDEGVFLDDACLQPGKEYRFPLLIGDGQAQRPLTANEAENYTLSLSALSGGERMELAGIIESGRQMMLSLTAAPTGSAQPQKVSYRLSLADRSGRILSRLNLSFSVGDRAASDSSLGTEAVIDPAAPLLTEAQLSSIEALTGRDKASFSGDRWRFAVRLLDQPAVNFAFSDAAIDPISEQWPQADFAFYTFTGRPSFAFSGDLTLDVSSLRQEHDTLYLYRYLDGVLYSLRYTDNGDGTLTIPTKVLGSYVVSDQKIANGTAVVGYRPTPDLPSAGETADKHNPSTGASPAGVPVVLSIAVLLGSALTLGKKIAQK